MPRPALKIVDPHASPTTPPSSLDPLQKSLIIDEYAELKRWKAEIEVRVTRELGFNSKRLESIEEQMLAWFTNLPADQEAIEDGNLHFLEVSAREFKRKFSAKAKRVIFKALVNLKEPLDAFDITLETVKAQLGNDFLEAIVSKERTGKRRMTVVPKRAPASA